MADVNGVSGPPNPAIGTGTKQTNLVIGVAPASVAAKVTAESWQQAALGNFIGVQAKNSGSYSQAQGDTPRDFDPSFLADVVGATSNVTTFAYNRTSSNQYKFGTAVPVATSYTVTNGPNAPFATGTPITVTVKDQFGNAMSGVAVTVTRTGGTATGGAVTAAGNTNGSGIATSTATASAAGTVTGTVAVAGITGTKPFAVTLT